VKPNAWYGWKPDLPDIRDVTYSIEIPATLPSLVDLREQFPPCYDQGELGSCTANAIAGALQFDQLKQKEVKAATPSRLFIYYNERVMEGTVSEDSGAEIRDGIKSVNHLGAPPETVWPYKVTKFASKPTKRAYTQGMAHQAVRYARVSNKSIRPIKAVLASGYPIVFGFTVYDYFESDEMAKTGILKIPLPSEQVAGGHAVIAAGYDESQQMVLVRNSWAEDWGLKGYFWMPYEYITNPGLADDFWVIRQVE
jgi:C1A family cysteine protease